MTLEYDVAVKGDSLSRAFKPRHVLEKKGHGRASLTKVSGLADISDITRRSAAAAISGGLAGALARPQSGWALTQRSSPMSDKIDTHQHYMPPMYLEAIKSVDVSTMMPGHVLQWSAESALDVMDNNGVAEGILSVSAGPKLEDSAHLLRKCNDYGADLRARHPGRFGLFASLPLPDTRASLEEIAYSLDTLKADGFIIFTNYDGHYLGNPMFDPIWEELDRRQAIAFIHPTWPAYMLQDQPPAGLFELPFETTRTAGSLILSGVLKRYHNIAFILSHAGGTLPFLSERMKGVAMMLPNGPERFGNIDDALRHFWYDTGLSMSRPSMMALLAVADPTRITFGTDFPFTPPSVVHMTAQGLAMAQMDDGLRNAIGRGNAARLLKRS